MGTFNIADLRRKAAARLPSPVFDYMDGGADDERALCNNTSAFGRYELLPSVLRDVSVIETKTTLFGRTCAWPLMLSPTGLTRMFHRDAEAAVARAAERAGLPYALSTLGTTKIEDIASLTSGPKLFQLYLFKDRGLTRELIARCKAANYDGLILTVDTAVAGNRERDKRSGFTIPLRLTPRSLVSFAMHPRWSLSALFSSGFDLVNVSSRSDALKAGPLSLFAYIDRQFDPLLSWDLLEWLAGEWNGPLAVKGLMMPDDAERAARHGATAVMISNHGGRQLGDAPAPIDQVAPVADRIGGRVEIICDGGIRRGSDVVKALALGANACSIGRPYLFGLAAGGESGVDQALRLLREEFERTLILAGVSRIADLGCHSVRSAWGRVKPCL